MKSVHALPLSLALAALLVVMPARAQAPAAPASPATPAAPAAPATPDAAAAASKAAEAAARAAHSGKVAGYQLCMAQDRVAAIYLGEARKAGKATGTPVAMPACANPGPFVFTPPAAPAAAAAGPATPAPPK